MKKFLIPNFKFLILLAALLFTSSGLAAGHLSIPSIAIHPDIYYAGDEILYLEGRAHPNSTVQIQFQKQGAKPIMLTSKSDGNGEWVLAEKIPLEGGDWLVRARVAESSGAVSTWSNPRIFKVIVTGITIGGVTIKFALLTFIIIILLIVGAAGAWYYMTRARRMKEEFQVALRKKELESVGAVIDQNFAELRAKITQELEHIEKRLKDGKLNEEEKEHREHLLRGLKEVEEAIEKKVKNIS
ncbi:hypothetical protein IIA95_03685 [Patescibacteria group bacterium]|nr:hypothetical protein [Patescibacteria group bacterium]